MFFWTQFRRVVILLPICWQYFFTCFFWLPNSRIFQLFDNFGDHLGSIWHVFWSAWEPRKWSQNVDGSTILTLWTSFFQAQFLGLNLLPTFSRLFALLGISGLHLGGLLGPFGSKMVVWNKARKKEEKGSCKESRGIPGNPGQLTELDLLAPKEEDLRPPSS